MATGSGSQHAVNFIAESVYGTTPENPTFAAIRNTSCSLNLTKDALTSKEIVSSRRVRSMVTGAKKIGGDLGIELCYGAHDTILEALLMGTWAAKATKTATTLACVASGNKITDSGNGFLTAGFEAGDVVSVAGFTTSANNTTRATIATCAAGEITFTGTYGDAIEDEAAGDSVTITCLSQQIKDGTTRRSFTIERFFDDLDVYWRFTGCEFDKLSMSIKANAIAEGSLSVIGQNMSTGTAILTGATYGDPNSTTPIPSFLGVMKEGGSVTAAVTELSFNFENGLDPQFVIGSQICADASTKEFKVTGQMTARFEDGTLFNKFVNETESSMQLTLPDAAGNIMTIIFPRVKYTGGSVDVKDTGPLTQVMPFAALEDSTTDCTVIIRRLAVA